MTDEQIKQKAEAYLDENFSPLDVDRRQYAAEDFIEGYHSRDEEIKELQNELKSLRKGFYERGDKLKELMLANNKLRNDNKDLEQALACAEDVIDMQRKVLDLLRNPWISVEERLPEKWKRIKVHSGTGEACWAWVSKTVFVNAEGWDNDPEKAFYDFDSRIWWSEYGDNIENLFGAPECWMYIPEFKKGE